MEFSVEIWNAKEKRRKRLGDIHGVLRLKPKCDLWGK